MDSEERACSHTVAERETCGAAGLDNGGKVRVHDNQVEGASLLCASAADSCASSVVGASEAARELEDTYARNHVATWEVTLAAVARVAA